MRVLIDTCVWSQVLRRQSASSPEAEALGQLIEEGRAEMMGPVRQELLSGVKLPRQYSEIREFLSSFEDVPLRTVHFEKAAEFWNACEAKGIRASTTDFLICAVAALENMAIFTVDKDYGRFAKVLPIKLFEIQRN